MAVLRGRGLGLEVALAGRDFDEAFIELEAKLGEQPGFYSGSPATASLGGDSLTSDQLARLRSLLVAHGVLLQVLSGEPHLEELATRSGLQFRLDLDDGGEELARRRALRPKREVQLSEQARSLVADFAGARKEIATRRRRGESSVRRFVPPAEPPPAVAVVEAAPATLYHVGTLRGGQALHNIGNIVVIGDANPGAELVAGGDIAVFGALRGVAHAGAQGDAGARVYAVELAPTQLRIATLIAAEPATPQGSHQPEAACVQNDRIVIMPLRTATKVLKEKAE